MYVPATVSVRASRNAPLVPIGCESRTVPSGAFSESQPEVTEAEVSFTLTRWFTVPVKVSVPFCPGAAVVTVADPPAAIVAVVSAGTS